MSEGWRGTCLGCSEASVGSEGPTGEGRSWALLGEASQRALFPLPSLAKFI